MKTITDKIDDLMEARVAATIDLLKLGSTYQRIGELTGLSITSIMAIAHKNGIRRGRNWKPPVITENQEYFALMGAEPADEKDVK